MGELSAGTGRAVITPPPGMALMGYILREYGAAAIHDDLYATALVLADGRLRLAIVCFDLLMLHPTTVARIRDRVAALTGIPAGRLMPCCSHTHSGPVTYVTDDAAWPARRAYLDRLVEQAAAAVAEGATHMHPAAWGAGQGQVQIGVNRRQHTATGATVLGEDPAGPVDPMLSIFRVDIVNSNGHGTQPLALLVHYACHGVCLGHDSYLVSADWPGEMRRLAESRTGARVGFVQGACADINPLGGPCSDTGCLERLGRQVGEQACAVYGGILLRREIHLAAASKMLHLALLPKTQSGHKAACTFGPLLDERFPWAAQVVEVDGIPYALAELQVLRLGDVVLAGLAGEPFVEIGLQVKARSPAAVTMLAGYANGSIGYIPVPAAYPQGGYEVDESYIYYRLPGPLAPSAAGEVRDGALALIAGLVDPLPVGPTTGMEHGDSGHKAPSW